MTSSGKALGVDTSVFGFSGRLIQRNYLEGEFHLILLVPWGQRILQELKTSRSPSLQSMIKSWFLLTGLSLPSIKLKQSTSGKIALQKRFSTATKQRLNWACRHHWSPISHVTSLFGFCQSRMYFAMWVLTVSHRSQGYKFPTQQLKKRWGYLQGSFRSQRAVVSDNPHQISKAREYKNTQSPNWYIAS